jgi:hypothetical protein
MWTLLIEPIPFFIVGSKGGEYLFVSPGTYGLTGTISWTFNFDQWAIGTIIPAADAGKSFTLVYADKNDKTKDFKVVSYKVNKILRRFDEGDSYQMAPIQTDSGDFSLHPLISQNKVLMSHYKGKITILDLNLNSTATYDVPAYYGSGVGVLYDKNKIPYVALSEMVSFGYSTTLPQLFDFTKVTPMPEATENLTISVYVTGDCSYYVFDKYCNVAVVRLYDTCSASQTQKISL